MEKNKQFMLKQVSFVVISILDDTGYKNLS